MDDTLPYLVFSVFFRSRCGQPTKMSADYVYLELDADADTCIELLGDVQAVVDLGLLDGGVGPGRASADSLSTSTASSKN